jgi:hypothetical protein
MKNKHYDLIHADPGVKLEWDSGNSTLYVSGEGRCELGEVRGSLATEGEVTVKAGRVRGDSVSYDTTRLTVQNSDGRAICRDYSVQSVGTAGDQSESYEHGSLTCLHAMGGAVSIGNSLLKVTLVECGVDAHDDSYMECGTVRGPVKGYGNAQISVLKPEGEVTSLGSSSIKEGAVANIDQGDLTHYLEMARVAMAQIPDGICEEMDISDDEFTRLRDQLHQVMSEESEGIKI